MKHPYVYLIAMGVAVTATIGYFVYNFVNEQRQRSQYNSSQLHSKYAQREEFDNECSICREEIRIGEDSDYLPCLHQFHSNCLNPWKERSNSCPNCRMPF